MSDPWIEVWCQGGDADGFRYETLVEPPEEILILADPFHPGRWIRVTGLWEDATLYERVRSVEQLDYERIYYPVQRDEVCAPLRRVPRRRRVRGRPPVQVVCRVRY